MKSSHPSLLPDQPCLVALISRSPVQFRRVALWECSLFDPLQRSILTPSTPPNALVCLWCANFLKRRPSPKNHPVERCARLDTAARDGVRDFQCATLIAFRLRRRRQASRRRSALHPSRPAASPRALEPANRTWLGASRERLPGDLEKLGVHGIYPRFDGSCAATMAGFVSRSRTSSIGLAVTSPGRWVRSRSRSFQPTRRTRTQSGWPSSEGI